MSAVTALAIASIAAGPAPDAGYWLQHALVALAVLLAAAFVLHSRAPALSRRMRVSLALVLLREGRPEWLRRVGRRLAPSTAQGGACGSCSGCSPR